MEKLQWENRGKSGNYGKSLLKEKCRTNGFDPKSDHGLMCLLRHTARHICFAPSECASMFGHSWFLWILIYARKNSYNALKYSIFFFDRTKNGDWEAIFNDFDRMSCASAYLIHLNRCHSSEDDGHECIKRRTVTYILCIPWFHWYCSFIRLCVIQCGEKNEMEKKKKITAHTNVMRNFHIAEQNIAATTIEYDSKCSERHDGKRME